MTFQHQLDLIANTDVASSIVFHTAAVKNFTASTTYLPKQNDNHVPSYPAPSYSSACPGSQPADLAPMVAPSCLLWLLRLSTHSLLVTFLLFVRLKTHPDLPNLLIP
jgi:hypothetical protein